MIDTVSKLSDEYLEWTDSILDLFDSHSIDLLSLHSLILFLISASHTIYFQSRIVSEDVLNVLLNIQW